MADHFTKEWIKKKSEQLGLPFANCLRGLLLEELFYRILKEDKPLELTLEDDRILGPDSYRTDQEPRIVFWTRQDLNKVRPVLEARLQMQEKHGSLASAEDIENRIRAVQNASRFHQEMGDCSSEGREIEWIIGEEISQNSPENRLVLITALFFEMKVPFTLEFRKAGENLYKEAVSFSGIAKKAPLTYYRSARELHLGEWLYRIWTCLELIPSMEEYDLVYRILKENAVDGRRTYEEIKKLFGEKRPEGKQIEILEKYKEYPYMKKRWSSYCKNRYPACKVKKAEEWQEMISVICAFSAPIWDCLSQNKVFVGDWMPELGRFM